MSKALGHPSVNGMRWTGISDTGKKKKMKQSRVTRLCWDNPVEAGFAILCKWSETSQAR